MAHTQQKLTQVPPPPRGGALTICTEIFGQKFRSNGAGIFFGTEDRNRIELYHLKNNGKFFAFSRHEAWH